MRSCCLLFGDCVVTADNNWLRGEAGCREVEERSDYDNTLGIFT